MQVCRENTAVIYINISSSPCDIKVLMEETLPACTRVSVCVCVAINEVDPGGLFLASIGGQRERWEWRVKLVSTQWTNKRAHE